MKKCQWLANTNVLTLQLEDRPFGMSTRAYMMHTRICDRAWSEMFTTILCKARVLNPGCYTWGALKINQCPRINHMWISKIGSQTRIFSKSNPGFSSMWPDLRTTGMKILKGLWSVVGQVAHYTRTSDWGASEDWNSAHTQCALIWRRHLFSKLGYLLSHFYRGGPGSFHYSWVCTAAYPAYCFQLILSAFIRNYI